jgi:O-antigen ligase
MGHWMNFGGQQMLVFTALLAFVLLSQHGKAKGFYWLLMVIVATSLILNFTRGVWLGCVVATVYIAARCKPRTLWVIPILLAVAYLAAPSMICRRVSLAFHPREDPALAIRLEMWGAGLRMIREHPWVGVGPENVPLVYTQYLPPGATPMIGYHDHLHDNFLQLAAERGLPCLVAWLWFMLALGWNILRVRGRLSSQRWVADAAFAAWLAFFAEGFFEFNFGTSPVLMVFLFVMSTPFVAGQSDSRVRQSSSPP